MYYMPAMSFREMYRALQDVLKDSTGYFMTCPTVGRAVWSGGSFFNLNIKYPRKYLVSKWQK